MFSKKFKTTAEIPEPSPRLIDQIIGQDEALEIVLSAIKNKRHALLLGDPGVGKSMMVKAVGDLVEKSTADFSPYTLLAKPNFRNSEKPIVESIDGEYKEQIEPVKTNMIKEPPSFITLIIFMLIFTIITSYITRAMPDVKLLGVVAITSIVAFALAFVIIFMTVFGAAKGQMGGGTNPLDLRPVVLYECKKRPLIRASAYNTTKLLGDIKHCPLGGKPPLGTPPHKRIILGAVHEAHKGVLYVDEIKTMPLEVQDYILSALQDKKLSISGRNPNSSGATVETNEIPCDFTLIMSGNMDDVNNLRAPLLDRIDYKIVLKNKIENNQENRDKLLQFITQEIKNNNLNPMSYEACCEIVKLAQKLAGSKDKLTLRLRLLSNIIKMASDIAEGKDIAKMIKEMDIKEEDIKEIEKNITNKKPENVSVKKIGPINIVKIFENKNKKNKTNNSNKNEMPKIEELPLTINSENKKENKDKKTKLIDVSHVKTIIDTGIYSLHKQVSIDYLKNFKRYKHISPNSPSKIGVIHGLAVLGADGMGDVTKIITEVINSKTPNTSLLNISGDLAKHSITLASALSRKLASEGKLPISTASEEDLDLDTKDIFIQFSQSYSKIDGDSATTAVCLCILSSLLKIPLKQDFAITGSLDLNGDILAIGGVNEKINAAKEYGFKRVIVPQSNMIDVIDVEGIEVIPAKTLGEIIPIVFDY
ncbi:ATP-dependent protease LonB [Methanococcus aeolicus]|uniref:ATP-dependent protease LonB n=1 Tax=Methanococcus aeolicus TaxID=42879 RepID=UPI0021CAAC4B|nr:ATP-dependent protease LonB [Methanococcus aeolicus]UXM84925.1 ATP-dependent protease LonB [Methanococcus aeolicus]